jgi:hypothetical protein
MLMILCRKFLPMFCTISCLTQAAMYSADPSVAYADRMHPLERPIAQETARIEDSATSADWRSRLNSKVADRTPPAPIAATPQLRQSVIALDRSAYFVNTVSARMSVTIRRGNDKGTTLDGVYIGDSNGNLRMRLTGLFGILAMDVTVKDGTLTCWMPTKKLLVQATRDELLDDAHSELAVLAAVGQARELFFPRPWAEGAAQRRLYAGENESFVGIFGGPTGKECLREYSIDMDSSRITQMLAYSAAGETIGRVEFAQYQPLTKLDSKGEKDEEWRGAFHVPKSLKLSDGAGRLTLDCTLEGLKINEPLKATAFDMDMPKGVTPQKAQALEKAAKEMAGVATGN